ncbi:SIR2 family protein [Bradyrhizobium sp. TM233]|uniref:SIR2 family protein n=1 Tax=Bradyrhizobium sp. TM233 TaxID=2599801 RepID=UPI0027D67286|nr:SIR2 family protein [Bradyrhizobium sp. TM233]
MGDRDKDEFLDRYLKELREENAAVFIGAGLSKAAGYVDWPGLIAPVANSLGLDATKEADLVALAQYYLNVNSSNRHSLNQLLIDEFSDLKSPTENHAILARLPIHTYWTTNYDRLIEKALEAAGKRVDSKYENDQLANTRRGRDAIIYKMHGDIEHPHKSILTKDDYEKYFQTHDPFITALSGDLVKNTFLFLGFSFTDPNIDFVLSRIRARYAEHQRQHYCVMRRRTRGKNEKKAEFEYALTKQGHVTKDLERFNIKTIFVDEFKEITELLRRIEFRYRRRTVFVSGSAAEFGPWKREQTEDFVAKLSGALIDRDLRITTGFGLGIGSAVVTGAVQQIYSTNHRSLDEQLVLRPFPIGIKDERERKATFERYREELIAQAGIAIFIMGNKISGKEVVASDGMRAEFEIAKRRGLYLIPVGASGSMASQLWTEVMGNLSAFYPKLENKVRPLLAAVGRDTKRPSELTEPILKLVSLLSRD